MKRYIVNVSHAVPTVLRTDFLSWVNSYLSANTLSEMEEFALFELQQKSPDGDDMIILQVFFSHSIDSVSLTAFQQTYVSNVHQAFAQKIPAFGSIMKSI